MQTYSFRAECRFDVYQLCADLEGQGFKVVIKRFIPDSKTSEVEVELETHASERVIRGIVESDGLDLHLILDTLRPVTLTHNKQRQEITELGDMFTRPPHPESVTTTNDTLSTRQGIERLKNTQR